MPARGMYNSLYCTIVGVFFTAVQLAVEWTRCCGATDVAALSALLRPQFLFEKSNKKLTVLWELEVHQCAY
jgi:hypothetical protein